MIFYSIKQNPITIFESQFFSSAGNIIQQKKVSPNYYGYRDLMYFRPIMVNKDLNYDSDQSNKTHVYTEDVILYGSDSNFRLIRVTLLINWPDVQNVIS